MANLEDLKAAVARNTSVDASVITLLERISQQLKDAIASNDPAALDQLVAQLDQNTQQMADAVTKNTPAEGDPSAPTT